MEVVLLITVGNTTDPILKAVEEIRREANEPTIFLFYGRPFPNQEPSPFDVAHEAKKRSEALGIAVRLFEAPDPEDINSCLAVARRIIQEAETAERLVVNFTGGTKPMAAAIVHAALSATLAGQLVLEYVGGEKRDPQGRVVSEAMRITRAERTATDERVHQTLECLRQGHYREASFLAENLPLQGRGGFVRIAVEALVRWDEFDYPKAVQLLRKYRSSAQTLFDDPVLAPLARLFVRMLEPGNRLEALSHALERIQQESTLPSSLREAAERDGVLLVADALENGSRRLREGRPTDSVLRAYRAVEVAVQIRLICTGVHPWQPQWDQLDPSLLKSYLSLLGSRQPPRNLALTSGLLLLETLNGPLGEGLSKKLQDLQQSRNHSYLEHGYRHLSDKDAQRLLNYAHELCEFLLNVPLGESRSSVCHTL